MRGRRKENVSKEGKTRGNLHPKMDGDTDGDPHWSTGLSPPKVQMRSRRRKNMNEHVIQPDSLNVAGFSECGWPGVFLKSH